MDSFLLCIPNPPWFPKTSPSRGIHAPDAEKSATGHPSSIVKTQRMRGSKISLEIAVGLAAISSERIFV